MRKSPFLFVIPTLVLGTLLLTRVDLKSKAPEKTCHSDSLYFPLRSGVFDFSYQSEGTMASNFGPKDSLKIQTNVQGLMIVSDDTLVIQPKRVELMSGETNNEEAALTLATSITIGVSLKKDSTGIYTGLMIPETSSPLAVGFFNEIQANLLFPRNIEECGTTSMAVHDLNGLQKLQFLRNSTTAYIKSFEGFIHKDKNIESKVTGEAKIWTTDASSLPTLNEYKSNYSFEFYNNSNPVAESSIKFNVRRILKPDIAKVNTAGKLKNVKLMDVDSQTIDRRLSQQKYQQTLGNDNVESLTKEIRVYKGLDIPGDKSASLVNSLHAYVSLQDDLSVYRDAIFGNRDDLRTFSYLVSALAHAGTDISQSELAGLVDHYWSDGDALATITTASLQIDHPKNQIIAKTEQLARSHDNVHIRMRARLANGALLKHTPNSPQFLVTEEFLRSELFKADDKIDMISLVALGNMNSTYPAKLLKEIENFPDEDIRAEIIDATRYSDNPEVALKLGQMLETESSDTVKVQIAQNTATSKNAQVLVQFLYSQIGKEKSVRVRLEYLQTLWKYRDQEPKIIRKCEELAELDESGEVRAAAARYLGSL